MHDGGGIAPLHGYSERVFAAYFSKGFFEPFQVIALAGRFRTGEYEYAALLDFSEMRKSSADALVKLLLSDPLSPKSSLIPHFATSYGTESSDQ